jgi:hypothetical protein
LSQTSHGHVGNTQNAYPGMPKARCGGPALCTQCATEELQLAVGDPLLAALIECHRPVQRKDHEAFKPQYLIQCPACDRNSWRVWQTSDPEVVCELWRQARARYDGSHWAPRRLP